MHVYKLKEFLWILKIYSYSYTLCMEIIFKTSSLHVHPCMHVHSACIIFAWNLRSDLIHKYFILGGDCMQDVCGGTCNSCVPSIRQYFTKFFPPVHVSALCKIVSPI